MEKDPILEKWDRRLNPNKYSKGPQGTTAATFTPDARALSKEIDAQKKRANAERYGEYESMKRRIQNAQAAPIESVPKGSTKKHTSGTQVVDYCPEPQQLSPEQKKQVADRQKASMEKAMEDARRRAADVERRNHHLGSIGRDNRGVRFAAEFMPTRPDGKTPSRAPSAALAVKKTTSKKELRYEDYQAKIAELESQLQAAGEAQKVAVAVAEDESAQRVALEDKLRASNSDIERAQKAASAAQALVEQQKEDATKMQEELKQINAAKSENAQELQAARAKSEKFEAALKELQETMQVLEEAYDAREAAYKELSISKKTRTAKHDAHVKFEVETLNNEHSEHGDNSHTKSHARAKDAYEKAEQAAAEQDAVADEMHEKAEDKRKAWERARRRLPPRGGQ